MRTSDPRINLNSLQYSLCGKGNQALFGPCIASTGVGLELRIDVAGPVYPGLSFPIFVRKFDHYNQTVSSDSSSFFQIRSKAAVNFSQKSQKSNVLDSFVGRRG